MSAYRGISHQLNLAQMDRVEGYDGFDDPALTLTAKAAKVTKAH